MDFDKIIDRKHTGCVKHDALVENFGRDDLIPLWVADMDFAVCPEITEALKQRLEHPVYGYAVTPDSYWQSIIDWLRCRHGFEVKREELTFVPGIVRAIAMVINALTERGDKVLIQQPVYHPFRIVTEGNGRQIVNNPLIVDRESGTVKMDFDLLDRQLAEEQPKLMILCNPHNPGGYMWDKPTLARLADICARHGVTVVSDEIHADLELFGNRQVPFATASETAADISITLGAPSKTFNIAGIVSSWCVVKNPALRRRLFTWLTVNEFNEPTFIQTAATEAAYRHGGAWLDECIRYIEGNIVYVEQFVASRLPQIRTCRPQASFLMWLDCSALATGKELQCIFIDEAHLALNDGEMFGPGGEGHMRLNVGCQRSVLEKALLQLEAAVNKYNGEKK